MANQSINQSIYKRLTHKQNMNFTYLFRHYKLFRACLHSSDVNVKHLYYLFSTVTSAFFYSQILKCLQEAGIKLGDDEKLSRNFSKRVLSVVSKKN